MKPYVVLVILEAKPGKEMELKQALMAVVEPHLSQNACLDYRLHQDVHNSAKFGIYARWISEEEHDKEFQKPYVQALMRKLDEILARPLEAIGAEEL